MSDSANTVKLHRVLRAPADRIYKAFLDPDALCRWLPPYGFLGKVHEINAQVGGGYRMSFINFGTGHAHSFSTKYLELKPGEIIKYTSTFDATGLPGEMIQTITLKNAICGTSLNVLQENIPSQIPAEMCYLGWQESLLQLANLVEPEIPSGE